MAEENGNGLLTILLVVILFFFLIAIIAGACAYPYYQQGYTVSCFKDMVDNSNNNIKMKLNGATHYTSLHPKENIIPKMQEVDKKGKKALIAILADWCGHCKNLKDSKILEKIAQKCHVYVISDKHYQAGQIMQKANSEGFPTLVIYSGGKMDLYKGPRSKEAIMNQLM